ncbi:MAG: class I SAM-dependent methyltransferase [Cyanobacteria bacterium P01_B01_bin.77]
MSIENSLRFPDAWTHNKDYANRYQTSEQISEVIGHLELYKANTLLDVGCGNGAFALSAAKQFPQCQIIAVDPLESAIEECKSRISQTALTNVSVKHASIESLPFDDACIDRVLIRNVIHHLESIDLALEEASRTLLPKGLIVIEAPCNLGNQSLGQLLSDVYFLMDDSHRRHYFHPKSVSLILQKCNVSVRSTIMWRCLSQMSSQAVSLINQHKMGDQLKLHENKSGHCTIELNFMRIIGQKTAVDLPLSGDNIISSMR